MVTDLLRVVLTRLPQTVHNTLLRACCRHLVNKSLAISDLLEQLVPSLLPKSTLFQNHPQTYEKLDSY